MMVQDEQENAQQEEFSRAIVDGHTQQETEPRAAPRDCKAGGTGEVGSGSGSVYFIRSPDRAFVKIGFTRLSVMVRCKQIGSLQPGLSILGYMPGTRDTEAWLHHKFADLRTKGEWFAFTPLVQSFLQNLGLIPVPDLKAFVRPRSVKKVAPIEKPTRNPAAVALGKLAASRRTKEQLAESGRQGGLAKAANRANGTKRIIDEDEADYQSARASIRAGGKDISLEALKKKYGY
jgi:hypothetical protein